MAITVTQLQPPPALTPVLDSRGLVTEPWYRFFRNVVQRLGQGDQNNINDAIEAAEADSITGEYNPEVDGTSLQFRDEFINEQIASLYSIDFPAGQALDQDDYNLIWSLNETNPGALYQWYLDTLVPLVAKGDLLTRDDYNNVRLPVGTDGQVVYANSSTDTGLEWGNTGEFQMLFNYGDATPKDLMIITADKIIEEVSIILMTDFDDPTSTLSIGDAGDPDRLLETTDNTTQVTGTYLVRPGYKYALNTQLILTIVPGVSTQGDGLVVITYQK
jgi:hypothetical protein